ATEAWQIVACNIWGFGLGSGGGWRYGAIRPRYGAGPKTAVCGGLVAWTLAYFLGMAPAMITHVLPRRLMAIAIAVGLVEIVLGTVAGAYFYREESAKAG